MMYHASLLTTGGRLPVPLLRSGHRDPQDSQAITTDPRTIDPNRSVDTSVRIGGTPSEMKEEIRTAVHGLVMLHPKFVAYFNSYSTATVETDTSKLTCPCYVIRFVKQFNFGQK